MAVPTTICPGPRSQELEDLDKPSSLTRSGPNCGGRSGWITLKPLEGVGEPVLLNASGEDQTPAAYDLREHYTKYEFRVPMRDGVRLFTVVLVPKDGSTTHPFMLDRTPFNMGPYGPDEYFAMSLQTQAFLNVG
jgi:predicted acyl esterase